MKQPRGGAGADLLFFVFFLVVLGVVWALTGGPERDISRAGPFLNPPFPLGSGTAYTVPSVQIPSGSAGGNESRGGESSGGNTLADIIANLRFGGSAKGDSPYAEYVTLSRGNTGTSDPANEYLVVKTGKNLAGHVPISAWRIESAVSGFGASVGPAAYLPRSGESNQESAIAIGAGTTVYLITGRSPMGFSFRQNICSGYFTKNQTLVPSLFRECPAPDDELIEAAKAGFIPSDACIDFIERMRACDFVVTGLPVEIGSQCQNFITTTLSYNGCVDTHRSDSAFYRNTWYVYLDRGEELWRASNDKIRLVDENGNVIATVSY